MSGSPLGIDYEIPSEVWGCVSDGEIYGGTFEGDGGLEWFVIVAETRDDLRLGMAWTNRNLEVPPTQEEERMGVVATEKLVEDILRDSESAEVADYLVRGFVVIGADGLEKARRYVK